MRVLLRADASHSQGTGHVMRCLTLGEELASRGHDVTLATAELPEGWLRSAVASAGFAVVAAERDTLDDELVSALSPDWVVVDSYRIPASQISRLAANCHVLAIVDGDDRGIAASLYLDQNLGASAPAARADRTLAGSDYALVRRAVLDQRRDKPWHPVGDRPHIVCFMGGTDPTGASVPLAHALAPLDTDITIVAPPHLHAAIDLAFLHRAGVAILRPTPDLPALFGSADIIVTAAGTSAWDVCALGIPSVLVAVVDNQSPSVAEAVARGVAVGLDVVGGQYGLETAAAPLVTRLLRDEKFRRSLSDACLRAFDGRGAIRVAERLEQEQ